MILQFYNERMRRLEEGRSQSAEFLGVALRIWHGFLHEPKGSLHNTEISTCLCPGQAFLMELLIKCVHLLMILHGTYSLPFKI